MSLRSAMHRAEQEPRRQPPPAPAAHRPYGPEDGGVAPPEVAAQEPPPEQPEWSVVRDLLGLSQEAPSAAVYNRIRQLKDSATGGHKNLSTARNLLHALQAQLQ